MAAADTDADLPNLCDYDSDSSDDDFVVEKISKKIDPAVAFKAERSIPELFVVRRANGLFSTSIFKPTSPSYPKRTHFDPHHSSRADLTSLL